MVIILRAYLRILALTTFVAVQFSGADVVALDADEQYSIIGTGARQFTHCIR